MTNELNIRFAESPDLAAIVTIYNQAIRAHATADLDPFTIEHRRSWFETYNSQNHPIYVAEFEDKVVGYCTISPYRQGRKALKDVAEISYYLDYDFHDKGIGTAILKYVISDCKRLGKKSLLAILLDTNTQSIALLEKLNFSNWGHFPDIVNINGKKCGQLVFGLNLNS